MRIAASACLLAFAFAGCASNPVAINTRDAVLVLDKAPA